MRSIGWHFAAAAAMFAWIAAAACVGDDPAPSGGTSDANAPLPGELGGACNEGRCLAGLVCTGGICQNAADGGGTTDAGGGGDASSDADAGPVYLACPPGVPEAGPTANPCPHSSGGTSSSTSTSSGAGSTSSGGAPSGTPCSSGTPVCCTASDNSCLATASECIGVFARPIACSGGSTCASTSVCCLEMQDAGALPDASACPYFTTRAEIKGTTCENGSTCGAGKLRVCRSNAECGAGTECRQLELRTGDAPLFLGVCL